MRPNETKDAFQPWHWVVIPMMGLTMGEIFYLEELAADCAAGQGLRVFLLRAALADHQGRGLADQSDGDQIAARPVK